MNLPFISSMDFLGILPNLVAMRRLLLENVLDVNYKDFLINTRQIQALLEAYFTTDSMETLLMHNIKPWYLLQDKIETNRFSGNLPDKILEPLKRDNSFGPPYFEELDENSKKDSFYVKKKTPTNEITERLKEKMNSFLFSTNDIQSFFNICENPSYCSSLLLRKRFETTIRFYQAMLNRRPNVSSVNVTLSSIFPFIGIMSKQLREKEKQANANNDNNENFPNIMYLLCHLKQTRDNDLNDISSEIDRNILNFINSNDEFNEQLVEYGKSKSYDSLFYFNKFLVKDFDEPTNIGAVYFISFKEEPLKDISSRKIFKEFNEYSNRQNRNWKTRFLRDEISHYRI